MRKLLICGIAGFLTITGCSSSGVSTAEVAENKKSMSQCMRENKKDKELCVDEKTAANVGLRCEYVKTLGTRIGKKVCTTAAQREEQRKRSKEMVDKVQRQGKMAVNG